MTRPAGTARRVILAAFAFQTIWFTGFFPPHSNPNELSRFEAVVAFVESGTFSIDDTVRRFGDHMDKSVWRGRTYSNKAPGLIFAAIPVYRFLRVFFTEPRDSFSVVFLLTRLLTVSLICFFALARFLRRLEQSGAAAVAGIVGCAVAFGTPLLYYSRSFFSHAWTASLLFFSWELLRMSEGSSRRRALLLLAAGFAASWAAISEYPAALVAVVLLVRAVAGATRGRIKALVLFVSGAAPALVLLALYDAICFGSPWRLSSACEALPAYAELSRRFFGLRLPFPAAIAGTLFSPRRGLLLFSPFLLWAVGGWILWWRSGRDRRDCAFTLAAALAVWLPIAGYPNWDGGWSLGMRYLLPGVFFAAATIPWALRTPLSRAFFCAAVGFSVALHLLGSLSFAHYPNSIAWPIASVSAWFVSRGAVAPNLGLALGLSPWVSVAPAIAAVAGAFVVSLRQLPPGRPRGAGGLQGPPLRLFAIPALLGVVALVAVLFVPARVWPTDAAWREALGADLTSGRYNSRFQ